MVNPVKNNPWYMNIIGVVDYMNSDKMSIDAIDKGEYVTQEELDSAIKKAKKIRLLVRKIKVARE